VEACEGEFLYGTGAVNVIRWRILYGTGAVDGEFCRVLGQRELEQTGEKACEGEFLMVPGL